MRRYLMDTGSASDFATRRAGVPDRVRERLAAGDRVGIGTPVLGELIGGIELSASRGKNFDRLRHALGSLVIWPFDHRAAQEYGRLFAALRRMGRPMQQIDIQIAAIAFSLGNCVVVSKDSDLSAVPGLSVENWSDDS
jgi:tRNA(fMet)-specific endonuclease VapC